MNDKKRGRPKKVEIRKPPTGYYMKTNIPKEAIMIRENNKNKNFKFENENYLYNYLVDFLNPNIPSPIGIVVYNASKQNNFSIRENLYYNLPNYENIYRAARLITNDFIYCRDNYNKMNNSNAKILCYTTHINLDMNRYKNLSVIYQFIYDIQQTLFPNQFTIWKLQAPIQLEYPFYVLRIIISNACVNGSGYISYMFSGENFKFLSDKAYGIINGTVANFTNSEINDVLVNPIKYDETINHYDINTKPNNQTYAEWYSTNYGEMILNRNPNRMINLKPYDYNRNKDTNNKPMG